LPDHVANQIAAGEVVQRPASVVKELLENAIDARASQVKLIVKDAGKTLIQVIDDGIGMSDTDARLCFERHATSKINTADDLFRINTKGFRGEALASIAAVAQVELKSRTENSETGTSIKIEGSNVLSQEVTVTPKGTSILVKNLFFNIPARRNFLKSNQVEIRHIIDEFQRVALAHPEIAFTFLNNGSEVFQLPGSNLRQRIVNLFGAKTNEKLVPVSEETPVVTISGFIQKPEFAKKSRNEQFFFANNRFIKSGYLHHAVMNAFEGLLKEGMQPGYFIYLELNPATIDVNIHPTKTEIKFEDEHTIYALLRSAVKHSLGQFNITPVLDFERDNNLETPYAYKDKTPVFPQIEVDKDFNPFKENNFSKASRKPFKKEVTASWEGLYAGLKDEKIKTTAPDFIWEIEVESEEVSGEIDFSESEIVENREVFQLHNKYLVVPHKEGLMLINQNLAHQRILYEEILKNITVTRGSSQQLLLPLELDFNPDEIMILSEVKEQLEYSGFGFLEFGKEKITIEGIPVFMETFDIKAMLQQLIIAIRSEVPDSAFSQNDVLAKSLSETGAVKNGTSMAKEQQQYLVRKLFVCKDPAVSPQGKKIFSIISLNEIEYKFSN
ncbi:MAG TPA: DNA mismatch repair endonuclease MutL, partial [Flavobacteriaceae bacterium]|nr:DNA mismatch repair endonuclease MutL [Flavobacteriaceae bacterium]